MLLFLFIFGSFIGSFLGVLIDRLPRNETVIKGRSYCEYCKKELQWFELIPLISFVFLRGRCRSCHHKISWYYPITELTTGVLFAFTYFSLVSNGVFNQQLILELVYFLLIVSSLIVIFFSDLRYGIIPDKVLLPVLILTFLHLFFFRQQDILANLFSGAGAFTFFLLLVVVTRGKGMGMGDVKYALFMGLLLGFPQIIAGFYVAFLTGAFVSIILILWRKKSFLKGTISFGPFLVLGTLISIFWGNFLWQEALRILGI